MVFECFLDFFPELCAKSIHSELPRPFSNAFGMKLVGLALELLKRRDQRLGSLSIEIDATGERAWLLV